MQHTQHYNLKKPELNDYVGPAPFNENADAIDAALHALDEGKAGADHSHTAAEVGAAPEADRGKLGRLARYSDVSELSSTGRIGDLFQHCGDALQAGSEIFGPVYFNAGQDFPAPLTDEAVQSLVYIHRIDEAGHYLIRVVNAATAPYEWFKTVQSVDWTTGNYATVTNWTAGNGVECIPLTQKGAAGGVATLDAALRVPTGQVPIMPDPFRIVTDIGPVYILEATDGTVEYRVPFKTALADPPPRIWISFNEGNMLKKNRVDFYGHELTSIDLYWDRETGKFNAWIYGYSNNTGDLNRHNTAFGIEMLRDTEAVSEILAAHGHISIKTITGLGALSLAPVYNSKSTDSFQIIVGKFRYTNEAFYFTVTRDQSQDDEDLVTKLNTTVSGYAFQ